MINVRVTCTTTYQNKEVCFI